MKQYIAWFRKVFADAAHAEERQNDVRFWCAELDNVVFLVVSSKYIRVIRRAAYRLQKNFPKKFGKRFCMNTFNHVPYMPEGLNWAGPYALRLGEGIDVKHTIYQEKTPFGTVSIDVWLSMDEMNTPAFSFVPPNYFQKGTTMENRCYEVLAERFEFETFFRTWDGYCGCYELIYGKQPPAIKAIKTHIE